MLKTLRQSFMLRCTSMTNMLIHAIRSLPLLNKVLHNDLYAADGFKVLAFIFVLMFEFVTTFIGKLAYVGLMVALPLLPLQDEMYYSNSQLFVHILLLLTLVGGVLSNKLIRPNDYALNLLRMDARRYTVANYLYYLLRVVIGFLPFTLIFGLIAKVPVWLCLLLPFSIAGCKVLFSALSLKCNTRFGYIFDESKANKFTLPFVLVLLFLTYFLPLNDFALPLPVSAGLMLAMIPAGLLCWKYVANYGEYKEINQRVLRNKADMMDKAKKKPQQIQANRISADATITSSRKGFEYLNELFIKRHRNILWKQTTMILIGAAFLLALLCMLIIRKPQTGETINRGIIAGLNVLPFGMYLINRGLSFTQALFMNCDHSLLTYPFYKKPKSILALFRIRLREIMKINAAPAVLIGFGLVLLLVMTGGVEQPIYYAVMFISPIAMSMFFSVHYLTIYYLLQPYTAGSEIKSPLYKFITGITYGCCYFLMQMKLPTLAFGLVCIAFCVIYCIVACILVYKFAAKTFKLRSE